MEIFEWKRLLFNEQPISFLLEVVARTFVMFIVILATLRLTGKRGVKQISIFEIVIIIALGSAAGDPMFYHDVGIVPAILVFLIIIVLYRTITTLVAKSSKFEKLIEGKPVYLVREGRFSIEEFGKEAVSQDEFFAELRMNSVEHLGQIKTAILETSGEMSVYYYPDEEVRYGLPLLPDHYDNQSSLIVEKGIYSCTFCGDTRELEPGVATCQVCSKTVWISALKTIRIR